MGDALRGVDTVIHLAARVHVMKDKAADPLTEFLKVNLYGTANLAQQAARAGVKRLVFVSSIKVNGESTEARPFAESDEPDPQDPYAVSKLQAEQVLQRISDETGLEVVIVRPPLVYGPGVKGNFFTLAGRDRQGSSVAIGGRAQSAQPRVCGQPGGCVDRLRDASRCRRADLSGQRWRRCLDCAAGGKYRQGIGPQQPVVPFSARPVARRGNHAGPCRADGQVVRLVARERSKDTQRIGLGSAVYAGAGLACHGGLVSQSASALIVHAIPCLRKCGFILAY